MTQRRQIWFCREGVWYFLVVAAVLGGAVARQLNLLMLVGCVLAGPLLFALIYGRLALRKLTVSRLLPAQLHAGERLVVDVVVANARRWLSVWGLEVHDSLQRDEVLDATQATGVTVYFSHVGPRGTSQVAYQGRLPQRGLYYVGPLRISTRFPLGLVRHTIVQDDYAELLVHPRLGRLSRDWARISRENSVGGQRMQRRGLVEADFYAVRDWRTGDSRRWIHWRTSARRGSLVVRQFEQRRSQDLAILVDLWQPPQPTEGDLELVERVISFVATIIAEACRQTGRQLIVGLAGHHWLERSGTASPLYFREQMDALALMAAHQDSALPVELGHVLALVPPNVPTLLVSTRALDLAALQQAALERGAELAGRALEVINASAGELDRYFHD